MNRVSIHEAFLLMPVGMRCCLLFTGKIPCCWSSAFYRFNLQLLLFI